MIKTITLLHPFALRWKVYFLFLGGVDVYMVFVKSNWNIYFPTEFLLLSFSF